jgi:hypothetical protein
VPNRMRTCRLDARPRLGDEMLDQVTYIERQFRLVVRLAQDVDWCLASWPGIRV